MCVVGYCSKNKTQPIVSKKYLLPELCKSQKSGCSELYIRTYSLKSIFAPTISTHDGKIWTRDNKGFMYNFPTFYTCKFKIRL